LSSKKPWIMGWTMGPERVCLEALIFCNKNMNSFLTSSLQSSIGMCCFVIIKALALSIDFSTHGLCFSFEVNHFHKKDFKILSHGLECSPGFLWNA
jgi:hypothetical protein